MAVGAAKILPGKAIPPANLPEQLYAGEPEFLTSGFQVIHLECDYRRGGQPLFSLVLSEDFELVPGGSLQDCLFVSGDPDLKPENVAIEPKATFEVGSRNPDP